VFYIIYLNAKDKTDYTGLEYEIIQQYDNTDEDMKIDWIPEGDKKKYDPVKEIQRVVKKLTDYNRSLEAGMKAIEESVQKFNESAGE
jgi:hypothetical protein